MKIKTLTSCLFMAMAMSSCIQDEALNSEADIETCIVTGDILRMDPKIENDRITLMVKSSADITHIAPEFTLTPGATIEPASGTARNFTTPQTYTVTSEDRNWKKVYTISCNTGGITTRYDFEHYELNGSKKYYVFYEIQNNEKQYFWASGNSGYAIVASGEPALSYPTTPYEYGRSGNCLKLETKKTGGLGAGVGMPIAAGNLFIGEFNALDAMFDALSATRFGVPFDFVPTKLKGYYKYKAGDEFIEKDGSINPNAHDTFDIYSILYETDDNVKYLDGRNFLTSPNLIAIARFKDKDKKETDDWTYFELPFEFQKGKEIDPEKLKAGKYNVGVVFSSSIEGNLFRGALGSQLLIDEIELEHNTNVE